MTYNISGLDTEKIKAGVGVTQVLSSSPGYDEDDSSASTESDVTLPSALGRDSAASERMTSQCDMTSTDISHTEQYKPIPPDQFDDLADRIANKVKRDLCLDKDTFSSHYSPVGHLRYPRDNTENKNFTTHHNTGKQQESQFTNHSCPQCSNLMVNKAHFGNVYNVFVKCICLFNPFKLEFTINCHLHPRQAASCCRNSLLVVDEDDMKWLANEKKYCYF